MSLLTVLNEIKADLRKLRNHEDPVVRDTVKAAHQKVVKLVADVATDESALADQAATDAKTVAHDAGTAVKPVAAEAAGDAKTIAATVVADVASVAKDA